MHIEWAEQCKLWKLLLDCVLHECQVKKNDYKKGESTKTLFVQIWWAVRLKFFDWSTLWPYHTVSSSAAAPQPYVYRE